MGSDFKHVFNEPIKKPRNAFPFVAVGNGDIAARFELWMVYTDCPLDVIATG